MCTPCHAGYHVDFGCHAGAAAWLCGCRGRGSHGPPGPCVPASAVRQHCTDRPPSRHRANLSMPWHPRGLPVVSTDDNASQARPAYPGGYIIYTRAQVGPGPPLRPTETPLRPKCPMCYNITRGAQGTRGTQCHHAILPVQFRGNADHIDAVPSRLRRSTHRITGQRGNS